MNQNPGKDLPDDEHLRADVGVPEYDPESSEVFSGEHYTAGQLNAGQQVAGLAPGGGDGDGGRGEELEERQEGAGREQ